MLNKIFNFIFLLKQFNKRFSFNKLKIKKKTENIILFNKDSRMWNGILNEKIENLIFLNTTPLLHEANDDWWGIEQLSDQSFVPYRHKNRHLSISQWSAIDFI